MSQINLKIIILLFITITVPVIQSANILFLSGLPSPSHHIWNKSIITELAERGHNLTVLTVEKEYSTKNIHFIQMENVYETFFEQFHNPDNNKNKKSKKHSEPKIDLTRKSTINKIIEIYHYNSVTDQVLVNSDGAKQLNNYPSDFKFDLIIHDYVTAQVLLGFVDRFNYPPLISVTAFNIPAHTSDLTNMLNFPSYIPHLSGSYSNQMTFIERIKNLCYWSFDLFYRNYVFMVNENRKARKLFGPQLPNLQTIEQRSELILVNIDFSLDYAQLLPPNIIPVGGLQVKRIEPLENDLKTYLDNSKNGVIYFSLGTNVHSSYLGETINIFLETFRQLPEYDFIWKYETNELENIPKNLFIREFLPQNSILGHKNVKLFMTHCGLLSIQESIWHGVPMLGFPVMIDQHSNMIKIVRNGLGEELNINNLTISELIYNIRNILETPSYKTQSIKRSKLFRNQPMHPMDRAIFSIETILKNGNAKHLKLGNSHLNIFQLFMLDIFGIILLLIILLILLITIIIKCFNRGRRLLFNNEKIKNE